MRYILVTLIAFSSLQAHALFNCVTGSGENFKRIKKLNQVEDVTLKFSYDLEVRKDSDERLEMEGPQDLIQNLVIKEEGKGLDISQDECSHDKKSPKLVLYVKQLKSLRILGSSDIKISDKFDGDHASIQIAGSGDLKGSFDVKALEIDIKGSGDIEVAGKADRLKVDIFGSGDVAALDLSSKSVSTTIRGSGDVKVKVSDTLDVAIYGSGDVSYKGRPKLNPSIYGSGSINPL